MPRERDVAPTLQRADSGAERALAGLGFTELESRIYCELLRSGPASGYRLAQRIGKAAANVYQALKTLGQKNAVTASDGLGEATVYNPTPSDELLSLLRQNFDAKQAETKAMLEGIQAPSDDERVYSIPSVTLLFERIRSMLAQAEKIVLIDFFPAIYDHFRDDIDGTRDRGVLVAGVAYDPRHAAEWMPLNTESSELVMSRWAGYGAMLVVDGHQLLVSQVARDLSGVLNAMWTDSAFLSCIFHSGLAADIRLVAMRSASASPGPTDPMGLLTLQQSRPAGLDHLLRTAAVQAAVAVGATPPG